MSLVSLTFGDKGTDFSNHPHIHVSSPMDGLEVEEGVENTVEVKKVCQFLGDPDVYLICEILSGVVCENMKGNCEGRDLSIVELECKYAGAKAAKKGMTVGLTVTGIKKSDVKKGETIAFSL